MTTTNIIGFILIVISIVVQVGSFVVRWFCIQLYTDYGR